MSVGGTRSSHALRLPLWDIELENQPARPPWAAPSSELATSHVNAALPRFQGTTPVPQPGAPFLRLALLRSVSACDKPMPAPAARQHTLKHMYAQRSASRLLSGTSGICAVSRVCLLHCAIIALSLIRVPSLGQTHAAAVSRARARALADWTTHTQGSRIASPYTARWSDIAPKAAGLPVLIRSHRLNVLSPSPAVLQIRDASAGKRRQELAIVDDAAVAISFWLGAAGDGGMARCRTLRSSGAVKPHRADMPPAISSFAQPNSKFLLRYYVRILSPLIVLSQLPKSVCAIARAPTPTSIVFSAPLRHDHLRAVLLQRTTLIPPPHDAYAYIAIASAPACTSHSTPLPDDLQSTPATCMSRLALLAAAVWDWQHRTPSALVPLERVIPAMYADNSTYPLNSMPLIVAHAHASCVSHLARPRDLFRVASVSELHQLPRASYARSISPPSNSTPTPTPIPNS
ncbi:hypothetical protein EVG20_g9858 [Dentipellis fragilis]|uniref:Uncharacterized protein n=1 Tax=Dentipellis fragilis TaxID=205917 RepID=A0A4Y9XY40_9AGAM|nr:hypothetical protein EVG20_g9858 [Dentipellis fragilis]